MWLSLLHLWLCDLYVHWSLFMDLHMCMKIIQIVHHIIQHLFMLLLQHCCHLRCPFNLICYNYSLLSYSCFELWSLYCLDGICLVTILRVVTPIGLILLCMTFWGLVSSPHFNFCSVVLILLQPQMCSFFFAKIFDSPLLLPSYSPKHVVIPF